MTSEGAAMTPLSDSEAATVQRFENAEPAPESWRPGGDDGLRSALAGPARDWQERHRQGSFVTTPDQFVNALLALPEIAALRAKADAADRVRHTRDVVASQPWQDWSSAEIVEFLDHALDGPC